ncbi:NUDIX hydrolase [Schaalia sp. 19OD2882]|uniref:NUDIX domain-containing protein n=1 Tax=Schaalia sp. 19OD2882 TaxID=2794089 RepID=UPI0020A72D4A|nr:NUDIX hydrolase [Schaalia sp. 19OD2882]
MIADMRAGREPNSSTTLWTGRVMSLIEDQVAVTDGAAPVTRQYTGHTGAVAVVALRGDAGAEEILVELQYRHPVRARLWEIPAGLLDVEGEDPLVAARRELAEETDLQAARWDLLVDVFTSPGGSAESMRIFLARELSPTGLVHEREDEEADLQWKWVSLDEAVAACLDGRVHNGPTVAGVLAAHAARCGGWSTLRAVDATWMR